MLCYLKPNPALEQEDGKTEIKDKEIKAEDQAVPYRRKKRVKPNERREE